AAGDEGETTGTPGYGGGSTGAASIAAAQPGQASLIVTPSNGAVGSRVLIQGRNFAPREIIDIGYARTGGEAIAIGRVTASEQGDFTAQTTAPGNTTAGVQLIFYARGEGGQTIETQPFVIGAADGTASGSPVPEQNNGQL
ncbi:MAG: hypothetical protein K2P95_07775, partial [Hyphomonadaceae bacterium]|nr:hypothetical protein [Hyphomonadaceae bacterium]